MKHKSVKQVFERLHMGYLNKIAALTILVGSSTLLNSVAAKTTVKNIINKTNGASGQNVGDAIAIQLPIMGFLMGIIDFMTGPFAVAIGIIALAAAALALFKGNGGPVAEKIIFVSIGISLVFFAPTIVDYIYSSADKTSGLTIF